MKDKAKQLWLDGHSATAIARLSGASVKSVYEWSRAWRREREDERLCRMQADMDKMVRRRA